MKGINVSTIVAGVIVVIIAAIAIGYLNYSLGNTRRLKF